MAKKIALLKGGWSAERDVSLSSGKACAAALREAGYDVTEIDVTRDLQKLIRDLTPKPDVVFNALHGKGGEDGVMQGILEVLDVPVTHSGLLASAIAMDKQKTKEILSQYGMPVAEGHLLTLDEVKQGKIPLAAPYVIKPNADGSSVGVFIVRKGDNKPPGGLDTLVCDKVLVEKYIAGRELTVAVMGGLGEKPRAMTVTEIIAHTDFYDYEAKYAKGGSSHVLPADIPQDVFDEALRLAELAHEKLGCAGVSRTDFRYDDSQPGTRGLVFLETNTQPGMTPTSLVPEQAEYMGMSFPALVSWMVEEAASRHASPDSKPALPKLNAPLKKKLG